MLNKSPGFQTSWSGSSRRDAFVLLEQMQECRRSRQATEAPDVSCAEGTSRCNRCTLPFCSCTRACPRSSTAKRLVGWLVGRALSYCHMHYASDRALKHSRCSMISDVDDPVFNFNDFRETVFLWYRGMCVHAGINKINSRKLENNKTFEVNEILAKE